MGKKAAGLRIRVPVAWGNLPVYDELVAQGHTIHFDIGEFDLTLGPEAHYFHPDWLKDGKALKNAVAAAKRRKKAETK